MSRTTINAALRFLDTVVLISHNTTIPEEKLTEENGWKKGKRPGANGFYFVHSFETRTTGANVFVKYYEPTKYNLASISLSFSVPKVYQGNNIVNIPQDADILSALYEEVYNPLFDWLDEPVPFVEEAVFGRIDISVNLIVRKDLLLDYLEVAKLNYLSKYRRGPYNNNDTKTHKNGDDNGVTYEIEKNRISLYDKLLEAGLEKNDGALRLEDSSTSLQYIGFKFGVRSLRVKDLLPRMCIDLLRKDLCLLRLDIPRTAEKSSMAFSEYCRFSRFKIIMDIVDYIREYPGVSKKEIASHFGITRRALNKHFKIIEKYDLLYSCSCKKPLRALTLDENGMQEVYVDDRFVPDNHYDISLLLSGGDNDLSSSGNGIQTEKNVDEGQIVNGSQSFARDEISRDIDTTFGCEFDDRKILEPCVLDVPAKDGSIDSRVCIESNVHETNNAENKPLKDHVILQNDIVNATSLDVGLCSPLTIWTMETSGSVQVGSNNRRRKERAGREKAQNASSSKKDKMNKLICREGSLAPPAAL
ncbi:MAG: helix-turn-helix transcriptional regulator [Anaerolineaceae bacterium]|nr:helix-turn-helix transcriptional regulator [Anaerolineaceae bacterium]